MKNIDKSKSRSSRMKTLPMNDKSFGSSTTGIESLLSMKEFIVYNTLLKYGKSVSFQEMPGVPSSAYGTWKYLALNPTGFNAYYGYLYDGAYIFIAGDNNIEAIKPDGFKKQFNTTFNVDYDQWHDRYIIFDIN